MLNGFVFSNPSPIPGGERWYCCGRVAWKCNVCLHVNDDYELVCISNEHTHKPPAYQKNADDNLTEIEEHEGSDQEEAMFVKSRTGRIILEYKGQRYRKGYKTRHGTRWICSTCKSCSASVYLNDEDEIEMTNERHVHPPRKSKPDDTSIDQNDAAVFITSRKGKDLLLFRQFTYRKQYETANRSRWVCSTLKNCHACVFTDKTNCIVMIGGEEHCHEPPKYYCQPDHVLEALRQPLILDAD